MQGTAVSSFTNTSVVISSTKIETQSAAFTEHPTNTVPFQGSKWTHVFLMILHFASEFLLSEMCNLTMGNK